MRPNGESAYSIPIQTPPGRGGVQPSVALVYSSNGGTREAGKGWSISGQSAIARCPGMIPFSRSAGALGSGEGFFPSSLQPNEFHTLCLDGQVMLPVNEAGTEFAIAGSPQITVSADFPFGLDGPGSFTAQMPDGSTQSFSGQAGERVTAGTTFAAPGQGGNDVDRVRRWPMTERVDSTGNTVTYTYLGLDDVPSLRGGVTTDHRLKRIDYEGGEIVFNYAKNPTDEAADPGDQRVWFWHGARTHEWAYLTDIEVHGAAGGVARTYELGYTRSDHTGDLLLSRAELCDREGVCVPATQFEYTDDGGGLEPFDLREGVGGPLIALSEVELGSLVSGDLNHDGLPDLLYITEDTPQNFFNQRSFAYRLSEGRNVYSPPHYVDYELYPLGVADNDGAPWYFWTGAHAHRIELSDLDGDGFAEPVLVDSSSTREDVAADAALLVPADEVVRIELAGLTGQDTTEVVVETRSGVEDVCIDDLFHQNDCFVTNFLEVELFDVDEDGVDEILACEHRYNAAGGDSTWAGPGTAYWTVIIGDHPSDPGVEIYTDVPCGRDCSKDTCDKRDAYEFADVTGDGRPEFLRLGPVDDELGDQVALLADPLSTGHFPSGVFGPGFGPSGGGYFAAGLDEQLALPGSLFQRYNERRGGSTSSVVGRAYGGAGGQWLDVNGDGLLDQVRFEPQSAGASIDNQFSELDIYVWACVDGEPADAPFEAGLGVFLNRGDGSFEHLSHGAPFTAWTDYCNRFQDAVSVDIDGDRVAELVIPDPQTGQADVATFSDGARSIVWSSVPWNGEDDDDYRRTFPFDLGGAGLSGFMVARAPVGGEYPLQGYWRTQTPDLLAGVVDGFGGKTAVGYGSLYDGVYHGGTSDDVVFRSLQCPDGFAPMAPNWPLVKSVRNFDGADEGAIERHRYAGLCRDADGRSPVTFEHHETSMGWWKSTYEEATSKVIEIRDDYRLEFEQAVYRGAVTRREVFSSTGNDGRYAETVERMEYTYVEDYFDRGSVPFNLDDVAVGKVVVDEQFYDSYSHLGSCGNLGSFAPAGTNPCSIDGAVEPVLSTASAVRSRNVFGTPTLIERRRGELCMEETWDYPVFQHTQRLEHAEVRSGKLTTQNGVAEWTCDVSSPANSPMHRSIDITYNPGVPDDPWLVDTKTVGSEGETFVVTDYGYDSAGQLTALTQAAGGPGGDSGTSSSVRSWSRTFDATGIFESTRTNDLGHTSGTLWHPDLAVPVASADANGVYTYTNYDGFGRGIGSLTQHQYGPDAASLAPPSETRYERVQPAGAAEGKPSPLRVVSVSPTGSESLVEYDDLGREVYAEWDVDSQLRVFSRTTRTLGSPGIDSWAQRIESTLPAKKGNADGAVSTTFVDGNGRVMETVPAAADVGSTLYRYEGRNSVVVGPEAGSEWVSTTSVSGNIERTVDAEGIVTCYYYGAEGRTTDVVVNPASGVCDGTIPADGPERSSTHFEYNKAGAVVSRDLPGRSAEATDYNAFGEPWRVQDASGTTTFAFDGLGRVVSRTDSGIGTSTFDWDSDDDCVWADGYLRRTTSADGATREFVYDAFGRVQQTSLEVDDVRFALDYRYDEFSRLAELRHLGGPTIQRKYDALGALSSVSALGADLWTADSRNALGAVNAAHYGNGAEESHLYVEGLLRESHLTAPNETPPFPGASGSKLEVDSQALFYDENGRISAMEIPHLSLREEYKHDRIGRLENSDLMREGTAVDSFAQTYWPTGAIESRSGLGTYQYNSAVAPLGVSQAGPVAYTYDADGRQRRRGDYEFTWNLRGRLTTATDGTNIVGYDYDANDTRVRKDVVTPSGVETTYYGDLVEYELTKTSEQVTYFVPGESGRIAALRRTPGEDDYSILYLHSTHNGSASVVTDEAGLVVERQDFDPFGRKRPLEWTPGSPMTGDQADVDIGFTGHRKVEEHGLIDMGGRHYDPHLGRFASPDPVLAAPGSSQGYDPFAYVFNDPLSFTDPSGFVPSASQLTEAMEDDSIGAGTAETTILSIGPHMVLSPPMLLSYGQIFGGVDAEAETEVGGEGAAGEPGAATPWEDGRVGGPAPIALERTQTELPRLPTPSFQVRPPVGGSAMDYLSYGVENYGAATWGFMAEGTNVGIALVESVVNVNYHAERAGVFAGRALVRTGQAMDNGNLWSWHTLMNIADDAAIASGEVGEVINGVLVVEAGVNVASRAAKGAEGSVVFHRYKDEVMGSHVTAEIRGAGGKTLGEFHNTGIARTKIEAATDFVGKTPIKSTKPRGLSDPKAAEKFGGSGFPGKYLRGRNDCVTGACAIGNAGSPTGSTITPKEVRQELGI